MKGFERMREMKINHGLHGLCSLTLAIWGLSAVAATGTSGEFRMDLSGMGPWEMRTARASEAISYSSAWATNALEDANAVVKVWPVKREKPKYIAIDLSGGTAATHYPIEYLDEIPGGTWSDEYKTSKLVLRHIPAGSFIMGSRATDYPAGSIVRENGSIFSFPASVNTNLHMVTLTKDFYMGVFEVTQRQWELVMGNRPSTFSNETCYAARPVESVSYLDIRGATKGNNWPESKDVDDSSFIGRLRDRSCLASFDLPTEAQWEYVCRAGASSSLNNGKNVTFWGAGNELCEISRNQFNSGWREGATLTADFSMSTTEMGTAKVGSYIPNAFDLYDMHGNVWEFVLDGYDAACNDSIDPVGSSIFTHRVSRGGGWSTTYRITSGYHWGNIVSYANSNYGFRLCLQGGELPEFVGGTALVNEAGSGTATWTPTKAGVYYLTHETQTNGVNGAELLGAWFEVAGPELTFTPDGDLTPGVKIAIGGAGDGWTVRYEVSSGGQGAARPTGASPEYTGPITLNDSQTIRAIAFSDGGLESREFSATYSLMSIGSAVAKPRYPWNGKVDIDCEVKGDANLEYLVSLSAQDLVGGTNLPLRTAWQTGGAITNNAFVVKPGTYRFTWDADADIAGDFDFAKVAVRVSAEGSAIVAAKKVLPLEVAGYTGTEVLTNVPVLVRLSTAISGFSYADFADANGGDVVFCDEGESVIYPHEIDEWHVGGESLVWVKLPEMKQGTKFKLAYGNPNYSLSTITSSLPPHEVWRDYAGVWHMNEDSGTAFDSTAHGLDALPSKSTNTLADVSQMVAYENGACGRARVNGTRQIRDGNYLLVPSYDALQLGSCFTCSMWVNGAKVDAGHHPRPMCRKKYWKDDNGWEFQLNPNSQTLTIHGSSDIEVKVEIPDMTNDWLSVSLMYEGISVSCYTNGIYASAGTIIAVIDNNQPLCFGCGLNGDVSTFCGQYDEIRLRGGTLSADRIKADYDMIKNRNFLNYGSVENGRGVK